MTKMTSPLDAQSGIGIFLVCVVVDSGGVAINSVVLVAIDETAMNNKVVVSDAVVGVDEVITVTGAVVEDVVVINVFTRVAVDNGFDSITVVNEDLSLNLTGSEKDFVTRVAKKRANTSPVKDQQTPLPLGTLVYIRNFVRKWKDCKSNGPFPVTESTTTAVKVQGHKPWYHRQDIRLAPIMPSIPLDTEQEKEGGEPEKQPK
ncbi:hypothetical protein NDU88_004267 [Pleurodeles waltl]|uniref:Uncharacterized protein n=1 Tax=Pleurodeles waltl TaxID=8319 RepID=A0AAV7UEK5_PLEWA|nr:hypothetical protein NDU88_004267 [Pleurodeles waltl]